MLPRAGAHRICRRGGGIELALTIDSRPFDLSQREADIAVRALALDGMPPEYLLGQKVALFRTLYGEALKG